MGKIIAFGPLVPSTSSRDIAAMFDRTAAADREAERRMKVYGCWWCRPTCCASSRYIPSSGSRTRRKRAVASDAGRTLRRASCTLSTEAVICASAERVSIGRRLKA